MSHKFFPYQPNHAAPIVFTVLFGLTMLVHIFQARKAKALFMLTLVLATAMEVLGYILRYLSIMNQSHIWSYAVSQTFIVAAPSFLAAQDYMIVGRMMSYVGPESTFISHTIITKLFVTVDIICVMTQGAGASTLTGEAGKSAVATGRAVLIAGLMLQVISFSIFLFIAILFDFKARAIKCDQIKPLRPLFSAFYLSAVLIIGRSIYRTIEFATVRFDSGAQGYLFGHEWPFYALDAIPIFIAIVIFNFINPPSYLPRKKGVRMDGSVEPQRRHWWSKAEKTPLVASDEYPMTGP